MAPRIFNRCSELSALNRVRSSDTLSQARTGPGSFIGDTHSEVPMLSPVGLDGEGYEAALFRNSRSLAAGVGCCAAKWDAALQPPIPFRSRSGNLDLHGLTEDLT